MKFKDNALPKTPEARFKYLYRLQELLRIFHNNKAKDFKRGKITEAEFRKFQNKWFKKRNSLICYKIIECKKKLTQSQKEQLLEYDEDTKTFGAVKNKELYKIDNKIKVNIEDIEEV